MKLRIHKNSIRLRLSQLEVAEIAEGRPIHEQVDMGESEGQSFGYHLLPTKDIVELYAEYAQNQINIFFPQHQAEDWAVTEKVSISNPSGSRLFILIEKDFQCLHQRDGEDESGNFKNPAAI